MIEEAIIETAILICKENPLFDETQKEVDLLSAMTIILSKEINLKFDSEIKQIEIHTFLENELKYFL